jgi:para-aminobenzoate synthetase component 1
LDALWNVREVAWPDNPAAATEAFGADAELAWLDSTADVLAQPANARYSLLCARPGGVLDQFEGQPAAFRIRGRVVDGDPSGWRLWRRVAGRLPRLPTLPGDLSPGWVGYVAYEMARQLEVLSATRHEDLGLPLLRLALFDRGIVLDHNQRRAFAVLARGVAEILADAGYFPDTEWLDRWEQAARADREFLAPMTRVRLEGQRAAHEQRVARAIDYIRAGDIYQVNLAQRLRLEGIASRLETYAAVRRANPAPYAALLSWKDGAVASVSPELFLRLRAGAVRTRPIKGTRPRTGDAERDETQRRELVASPKEAAELTMIVDLHRNDLGRVCEYGSVRVEHPRRVEAHPSVFHTVADVTGRLAAGRDGLDLLMACFPAGSISGVPKIRALQIIDELEPVARGAYTGAIGVLGLDGQMTWSVAIRTLQMRGTAATLYVGGGIVADSDPAAEYDETLAKARGILSGITTSEERVTKCGTGSA